MLNHQLWPRKISHLLLGEVLDEFVIGVRRSVGGS